VWFDEDIGELDEQTSVQRLSRPSVTLYDELGVAVVYFSDGNIFGGHSIEVTIENGMPTDVDILG
jgi:hypothetical protein